MNQPQQILDLNLVCDDRAQLRAVIFGLIRQKMKAGQTPSWIIYELTPAWKKLAPDMKPENRIKFELEWRYIYKLPYVAKAERFTEMHKFNNASLVAYASALYTWMQLFRDESGDGIIERVDHHNKDAHIVTSRKYAPETRPLAEHYGISVAETQAFVEKFCVETLDWERDNLRQLEVLTRPDKRDEPVIVSTRSEFIVRNNKGEEFRQPDIDIRDTITAITLGVMPYTLIQYKEDKSILQDVNNYNIAGTMIGSNDKKTIYQRQPNGSIVNMTKRRGLHQPAPGEEEPQPEGE
jgi:hypothetical protein